MPQRLPRVDRKSLKRDPLVTFTSRAMEYASTHAARVLGIAAAVIAVAVLASFWSRGRTEKASTSDLRASTLVAAYSAGQFDTALQMADNIIASYPGSRGAVIATYVKGKALLQTGKAAEAAQSFRSYLESASKAAFFASSAQQGLAASLEAQGRFAEAAEIYQRLAAELKEPLADEATLDAARACRLAGATDQARKLLEALAAKDNVYTRRARIELAVLGASAGVPGTAPPSSLSTPPAAAADTARAATP